MSEVIWAGGRHLTVLRRVSVTASPTGVPTQVDTLTPVTGRMRMLSAREATDANTYTQGASAVAHVTSDVTIAPKDRVEWTTAPAGHSLAGIWEVAAVFDTDRYRRVILRRGLG